MMLKEHDRILLETKLLSIGLTLRMVIEQNSEGLSKTQKFKAQQTSAPWKLQLRGRELFAEEFDLPQLAHVKKSPVSGAGKSAAAVSQGDVALSNASTVMLYMMGSLAYGRMDRQLQQKVDTLQLAEKPVFKIINAGKPSLWSGDGKLPARR